MSIRVMDTDILSLLLQGHPDVVREASSFPNGSIVITVISLEEQLTGWYTFLRRARTKSQIAMAYERLAKTAEVLSGFPILTFDEPAIDRCDALVALRLGVRKPDLRIAAITLENAAILVTRNLRDFRRVPGLILENWVP